MKGVFEKPRKKRGGSLAMASIRKKHEDFIRELQAPLKTEVEGSEYSPHPKCNVELSDFEIQKELERKFDELFGSISSDGED